DCPTPSRSVLKQSVNGLLLSISIPCVGSAHSAGREDPVVSAPIQHIFVARSISRDCCTVNASDCPLSLHAHPGGGNAASHRLDAICWVSLDRKTFYPI
ncbi:hypothetical protein GOODEAATRI_016229, partial [Goodea atripinnis]